MVLRVCYAPAGTDGVYRSQEDKDGMYSGLASKCRSPTLSAYARDTRCAVLTLLTILQKPVLTTGYIPRTRMVPPASGTDVVCGTTGLYATTTRIGGKFSESAELRRMIYEAMKLLCRSQVRPYTLHPTPYTLHPTPYTLYPISSTLHPIPYILDPTPYTLYPRPYTLHPAPYTLHPTPYTLDPTPYILDPTPYTLTP
eukprot:2422568-Rhodomonas_salina.1